MLLDPFFKKAKRLGCSPEFQAGAFPSPCWRRQGLNQGNVSKASRCSTTELKLFRECGKVIADQLSYKNFAS